MSRSIFKLKITLLISIIILAGITVTYAAFFAVDRQRGEYSLSSSCFSVNFEDSESINISGAIPMSDAEGMYESPYELSITNNCPYDISFEVIAITNIESISNQYMKYMFDGTTVGLVSEATSIGEDNDLYQKPRILGEGVVSGGTKVTKELRFWLDENTNIESVRNKAWHSKIETKIIPKDSDKS